MKINELKRELSKLSGIDFFNPKYRDVFNKYSPEEDAKEDEDLVEDVKAIEDDKVEDVKEAEDKIEDKVEDVDKAEDEREIDKIEEDKADDEDKADEKAEEVNEESEEIGKDVDELKEDKTADELLDAKIELELIHNGVKPEKIDSAKKYVKHEVASLDELDKVKEILKEYPEWVAGYKSENFGMPVDEDNGLTEEEKRLVQMGINPRD